MFEGNRMSGKIFRDTERSLHSRHFKGGFQSLNEEYTAEQRSSESEEDELVRLAKAAGETWSNVVEATKEKMSGWGESWSMFQDYLAT